MIDLSLVGEDVVLVGLSFIAYREDSIKVNSFLVWFERNLLLGNELYSGTPGSFSKGSVISCIIPWEPSLKCLVELCKVGSMVMLYKTLLHEPEELFYLTLALGMKGSMGDEP